MLRFMQFKTKKDYPQLQKNTDSRTKCFSPCVTLMNTEVNPADSVNTVDQLGTEYGVQNRE